ncbi:protein POLYCHOME-like [Pyrus ussuriensis x Pyrus communis]|uniref:Protein POLYCHOME-like n=1 Tax=Pyrus ussuriensis x Pyrus communis TaxID=2448454 RepID=A0A5N5G3Z9_9ROSA|nr:protein POLYCHOME-like [Pyrus ussuriensis x Pyrus communis]
MPEARDRLSRPVDLAAAYAQRLAGNRRVYIDPPEQTILALSPPVRRPTVLGIGATGIVGGGGLPRSSLRTPITVPGRGRIPFRLSTVDRENTPSGSSHRRGGRASNSVLPYWYPRSPLQDITAVVRAIERRRARLVESDGENTEGQVPQDQNALGQSLPVSGAQFDHGVPMTPYSAVRTKRCLHPSVGKVQQILRDASNQPSEEEFLTPQKKLMNSIDMVEKVVRKELERLKRTPSAKKAERDQKVRTLMSMR